MGKIANETLLVPLPREYTCWPANGQEVPVWVWSDADPPRPLLIGYVRQSDIDASQEEVVYDNRYEPK